VEESCRFGGKLAIWIIDPPTIPSILNSLKLLSHHITIPYGVFGEGNSV
jgi:hypothetical protein